VKTIITVLFAALILAPVMGSSTALAQDDGGGAPSCVILTGATVYAPGAKRLDKTDVRIEGDRITGISGVGVGLPQAACRVIDGAGKVITAGFIDAWSTMGLVDIDGEASTVDTDNKALHQDAQNAIRAAVRTSLGLNPRSAPIQVARLAGITSAIAFPTGGLVAGQGFWIDLAGARRKDVIQKDPVGLMVNLGARTESRATSLFALDVALREAELWRRHKGAIEKVQRIPLLNSALDLEALGEVIAGRLPLVVRVDRAAEIESLLEVLDALEGRPIASGAARSGRLVLVGAAEAWLLADELARRGVAVILDPLLYGPGGFDQLAARRDHAALLTKSGVQVMLSPMDTHLSKKLRQLVGNAIREGLSWESGLISVTETPAAVFGLKDHGRLAVGAKANLVVWSGDPFELSTQVHHLFIGGREVALTSRQTELFERWRSLPAK